MKKLLTSLTLGLFAFYAQAQAPQAFNYQAVARTTSGTLLQNTSVAIRISIRDGSPSGSVVYSERDTATTNQFGLFTCHIGTGSVLSGVFSGVNSTINWGLGDKYMQVELDPAGGASYIDMGTTQLLSVPYAFYSGSGTLLGTTNYLAKFTSATNGGNSKIYDDGTNVGIGTSFPNTTLDVNGRISVRPGPYGIFVGPYDQATDNFAYYSSAGQVVGTGIKFETAQTGNTNGVVQMTILSDGKVGIGTDAPTASLEVLGGSGRHGVLGTSASAGHAGIRGDNSNAGYGVYGNATGSGARGVVGNAPAGIGVYGAAANSSGLGVYGYNPSGVGIKGESASASHAGIRGDNTNAGYGVSGYATGSGGRGVLGIAADGIGVYGSSSIVSGSGVFGVSTDGVGVKGQSADSAGVVGISYGPGNAGVYGSSLSVSNGNGVYGEGFNGVVGVNTSVSGYSIYGQGVAYFSGNVIAGGLFIPSDSKFKNDIIDQKGSLYKLMSIRPKQYKFNTEEYKNKIGLAEGVHYGVISQELQKLFPDMVLRVTTPSIIDPKTGIYSEPIEYLSVNYTELIPITISAIQEQQQQIEELRSEIAMLKKQNAFMMQKMDATANAKK